VEDCERTIARRTLALVLLAACATVAGLLASAEQAHAAYSANVSAQTLTITGDGASDKLALRLASGSPNTLQVDVGDDGSANFSFDRTTFTSISVNAGAGKDRVRVDEVNGAFTDEAITIDGGGGGDTLLGGSGADFLLGGLGVDLLDGNRGDDVAFGGEDGDTFQWDAGDGSDILEGQTGADVLDFNGSNVSEIFEVSANGGRVRFVRDVGAVTMDLDDVERLALDALGGADTLSVNDLTGTDLTKIDANLAALGGGDTQADTVTVNGSAGADAFEVRRPATGGLMVQGLGRQVLVKGAEALDHVAVNGLAGNDTITGFQGLRGPAVVDVDAGLDTDTVRFDGSAAADNIQVAVVDPGQARVGAAGAPTQLDAIAEHLVVEGFDGGDTLSAGNGLSALTALLLDGGGGDDTLLGGDGADILLGGAGFDLLDGNRGNDLALAGSHGDTFRWDPGDGSDVLEGQEGADVLDFNGSNTSENFDVSANGGRVRFVRDVANVVMDFDNVERLALHALGGADTLTVNDLAGTDLTNIDANLAAFGGGGDAQPDSVTVNGTAGPDAVKVGALGAEVFVKGLAAVVRVTHSEVANDDLHVNTLAGNDNVIVDAAAEALIDVIVDLGPDE
jgi:Ca2+-binding RTX toxin-like protein